MDEREMFEAWARTCEGNCNDLDLHRENGEYAVPVVERDWIVWQASRRTTPDRDAIIDECAKVCDEYAADQWSLYKGRAPYNGSEPGRADPDVQGRSDGADVCAERIRALKTAPTSDKGGA